MVHPVFNGLSVAGAVLQTALLFIHKGAEEEEAHCINSNANGTYDIFF